MPSVLLRIQKNGLCCGCGVCAALCPHKALSIKWNTAGEYMPIQVSTCTSCGICLPVCPFENGNSNENDIGDEQFKNCQDIIHTPETGYYLTSYVGHVSSEEQRWKSASGGLATWFLRKLLQKNIVDAVLCVRKSSNPSCLYEFFVAKTEEDIHSSTGSAYYPTEMSKVLQYVLKTPGKYALIGLPCFVKAVRLAQQKNKILRERIIVFAGLTCGHMKSTEFTDYIAHLGGLDERVVEVSYRCKSMERPAGLFSFNYIGESGNTTSVVWDKIGKWWSSDTFTVPACNFCDDIFAECADVTFMDAWLPEYSSDPRGTSLCIVRSPLAAEMFLGDEDIVVSEIPITKVIESQRGVVWNKRTMLSYRLSRKTKGMVEIPVKRVKEAALDGAVIQMQMLFIRAKGIGFLVAGKILRKMKLLR